MTTNSNPNRVLRGGSWNNSARFCRSAYRDYYGPDYRSQSIGFRPVLKPNGETEEALTHRADDFVEFVLASL